MSTLDFSERRQRETVAAPTTIMIVDDSAALRKLVKQVLQTANLRVIEAADGREAIAYCMIDRPALVLLDIDMPIMDGLETLRAMKEDKDLFQLPVLMLTAHTGGADVAAALELGAQDYLRKPCDPAELVARIRTALKISEKQEILFRRAEELGEMSATDPLTELGNRRYMAQQLSQLATTLGAAGEIAVMEVDIDRFKRVNDEHGHLVGDAVLSELAQRLRSIVSPTQTLVRWGGEEFLIIIPAPLPGEAEALAETVRSAVDAEPFGSGSFGSLRVTISMGCALGRLDKLTDVIRSADVALYAAKGGGRNRVEWASGETP